MTDTNIAIKGKRGCSDTGITEELASKMFNLAQDGKATELVAIVRFTPEITHKAVSGSTRTLDLAITDIEPVVDGKLNGQLVEHVREIQAALFRNRALTSGTDQPLPLDDERDGPAPKVADLLQQGKAFFDKDADGNSVIHQPDEEPAPV